MWRMYCVCLLSVIVVLDLLGQSHVNRNCTGRTPLHGQFKCSVCCCRSMRVHVIASQHTYHTVALLTVCRFHGS